VHARRAGEHTSDRGAGHGVFAHETVLGVPGLGFRV
jgi:hypothetical protein